MVANTEKGGYDVQFVGNGPNDGTCSICFFVLREPMQAEQCGHRFCKSCLEDLKGNREIDSLTCPQDQSVNKIFRDRGKECEIMDYLVKCTNVNSGCQWTGELRNLEKHKESCENQLTSCKNEGCGKEFQRKFLEQHVNAECSLRVINCEYCKVEVKFCLLDEHNQGCSERPVQCSRCKSKDLPKDMIKQHLELECPFIVCDYSDIGCQKTVKRKCMSEHKENATEGHLDCVITKLREQSETIKQQKLQLEEQKNTIKDLQGKLLLQEKVNENQEKVNENQEKVNENQEKVNENQEGVLEDVKGAIDSTSKKLDELQPVEAFKNELIWVIDDFKEKLKVSKKENSVQEQIFFTKKGYKCKAFLFLNGNAGGKSTHVSVFFGVQEGPFDDALEWQMDATISFCVLKNGVEKNKLSFSTTKNDEVKKIYSRPQPSSVGRGYSHFIHHDSIWDFVVDNTFTLKISVQFS